MCFEPEFMSLSARRSKYTTLMSSTCCSGVIGTQVHLPLSTWNTPNSLARFTFIPSLSSVESFVLTTHQPVPKSRHRQIPPGGKSPEPRHLGLGPRIPGPLSCPCMGSRMRLSPIPGARPPHRRDRSEIVGFPIRRGRNLWSPPPAPVILQQPPPRNPTVQSPSSTPDGQLTTHFWPNHGPPVSFSSCSKVPPLAPLFFPRCVPLDSECFARASRPATGKGLPAPARHMWTNALVPLGR